MVADLTWIRTVAAGLGVAGLATLATSAPRAAETTPTFTRDVAPILYEHCSTCHRPGESAPFDLLTYEDAKKRARQIVMVTQSSYMPPWLPARQFGRFQNERGLDDDELNVLLRWYEQGSPAGDPADLPPAPRWVTGWQLGEPDLVIEAPETYTLPADGVDVFRNLIVPIPLDTTRYVRTIDLRPGNPRIVHHAVMRVDRSRSARLLDQADDEPGYPGMEWGEAQPPEGHFLGWTPGRVPYAGSDELAWVLEPGSDLVVQLHMVPSGRPETIRPEVGIYFADGPPTRMTDTIVLDAKRIDIPAGERAYVVEESYEIPIEIDVLSVYPHAHYLGKRLESWAILPDDTRRWLIRIPDWDFNWQDQYRFVEPVRLPAGSKLAMRIVYDNSADNPRNPHTPPRRVTTGNRSTDEMGSMSFEVVLDDRDERDRLAEALLLQDLERWPGYWVAHGLLGTLYLNRGDPTRAVRHLERALFIKPDYPVGHNNLGAALSRLGKRPAAMESFRKALEQRPGFPDAHYNLAVELAALGKLEDAVHHYRLALEVRTHDADLHNNLGVALAMLGRLDEATVHFRRALALDPDSAQAHGNLGNMLMERRRYAEAIRAYRKGLELRPGSADLEANLAIGTELLEDAEARIARAESDPDARRGDPRLLADLADLYAAAGRYEDATTTARRALELATSTGATGVADRLRGRLRDFATSRAGE